MFQGTGALAFNATFYLQTNPDVFTAIQNGTFQGSALDHFVQFGQFEGRDPNAFFDTEYYLAENPDVLTAIADPANPSVTSAFQHFVMFGADEGVVRAPSAAFASFNAETYFAQNPDLQAAFGNLTGEAREDALFSHFVEFGVNENRPGSGVNVDANPGVPGQTFALTTGVDALVGTGGNDTFTGLIGAADKSTFNAGDSINGGAGTDRLNITATAAGAVAATTLTNVEQVYARVIGANAVELDAADWSGVNQLWLDRGTAAGSSVTYDNIQNNVTLGLNNTQGTLEANFAANVIGSAATVAIASNSSDAAVDIGAAKLASVSIAAEGENELTLTTANTLRTVTITGNGSLDVTGAALDNVTTVDASANVGGVDVDLSDNVKDVTVTGGSGDDRFVFDVLGVKDVVNGGAGFDTVAVDGAAFLTQGSNTAFNALTNVERLEFVGGTGAQLTGQFLTNAGITNLLFNTTGPDIINVAGSARTYEFGADNAGAATFNMKSGATELNVDYLGEAGATNNAITDGLNVNLAAGSAATAVSTINIDSLGDVDDGLANATGIISARNGSTINITGDADLDVAQLVAVPAPDAAVTTGFTIDASAFTGELTIRGSVRADTITLGEGEDTVQFAAGDSGVLTAAGPTQTIVAFDVITGFTAGEDGDTLDFLGVDADYTAITGATQTEITDDAENLLQAFNIATDGVEGWTAFEFGGLTYAAYNDATDGFGAGDVVVQLNGVSVADLDEANFA